MLLSFESHRITCLLSNFTLVSSIVKHVRIKYILQDVKKYRHTRISMSRMNIARCTKDFADF